VNQNRQFIFVLALSETALSGCFGKKQAAPVAGTSAEPDKVLYERATQDLKKSKYTVARLALQTLINTYPDSEYLAKAKLEIADSYYKEAGTAGLKQAIVEYKDFITFFPFLDEAAYAQLQLGMAHYRQMEKPDRDHAEAVAAEAELQTFLEKYPESPLAPEAAQRLRETQEVLAEGNFRIASFYQIRGAYRASGARLIELTTRYPLYSQADKANWMLGQVYEKTEHGDIAAQYYTRIVKDYPLSSMVGDAKERLNKLGAPIPQPDPGALARMQKEQEADRDRPGIMRRSLGVVKRGPDVTLAAHAGDPTLTPASESGDETLSFGPAPAAASIGTLSGSGSSATVETVIPGSPSSLAPASLDAAPAASTDDASSTAAAPAAATAQPTAKAAPADKSQESTSKKKKGIHKIIPF
jgi:outer membrane protein assembly factor BamD